MKKRCLKLGMIITSMMLMVLMMSSVALAANSSVEWSHYTTPVAAANTTVGIKSNSSLTPVSGGYMRVFYNKSKIGIEYYDSDFNLTRRGSLDMELPIWGGFYAGEDGNYYIAEGQNNTAENDSAEIIRIIKYDKDWNRKGAASITSRPSLFGGEVRYPFDVGGGSMCEYGGNLYLATGHEGYVDPAYNQGHQGLLIVKVNMSSMSGQIACADLWHSFSQIVRTGSDGMIYLAEQSDGNRCTQISKYDPSTDRITTTFSVLDYGGTKDSAWSIPCLSTVDDLALASSNVLCIGTSIDQTDYDNYSSSMPYNIYLSVTPRNSFTQANTSLKWLTSYSSDSGVRFKGVHLTKINDNRFMVSWQEAASGGTIADATDPLSGGTLHYLFIDGSGNVIGSEMTADASISDCEPVVVGNNVVFYTSSSASLNMYTINGISGAFSKKVFRIAGDDALWELEDGELTIRGTGELFSFSSMPSSFKSQVTSIKIEEGITAIPASGFTSFSALTKVEIGDGLQSIGKQAFYDCSSALKEVHIPPSTTSIGDDIVWTGYTWSGSGGHVTYATIYGKCDSTAIQYAKDNNINNSPAHQLDPDYTIDLEPTCTERGSKSIHCQVCGAKTSTESIPATGHDYVQQSLDTENGLAVMKCSKCNNTVNARVPTSLSVYWKGSGSMYTSGVPVGLEAGDSAVYLANASYSASSGYDSTLGDIIVEAEDPENCLIDMSSRQITFNKAGDYKIIFSAKYNPDVRVVRTITIVKPLESVSLSTEGDLMYGNPIRLVTDVDGGKGSLSYNFIAVDEAGNETVIATTSSNYYSWRNANAGDYKLRVEVTDKGDNNNMMSSDEISVTVKPQHTVIRYGREITAANELTYGDKLSALRVNNAQFAPETSPNTNLEGSFAIDDSDEVLPAGTHTVGWTFVPSDPNYAELTGTLTVKVKKAVPQLGEAPTTDAAVYHPDLTLAKVALNGGSVVSNGEEIGGEWQWKDSGEVPAIGTEQYTAVFVPEDQDNYESVEAEVSVTVDKATPYIASISASDIVYGDTLAESELNGEVQYSGGDDTAVDGSFSWSDGTVMPAVADSLTTDYAVLFTPDDTYHYNSVGAAVTLKVEPADIPANAPPAELTVPYYYDSVKEAILAGYNGWEIADEDLGKALAVEEPLTVTAVYSGGDPDNYKTTEVTVVITRTDCSHENITWLDAEPIYCLDDGVTGYWYCEGCNGYFADRDATEPMIFKSHTPTHSDYAAPSCTEDGSAEYWKCEVCGKYFGSEAADVEMSEEDTHIAAPGHKWDAGQVTVEPTIEAEGEIVYSCTVCNETRTEKLDKLPDPKDQMGEDGTPVGPGASEIAADIAITGMKTDADPKGSTFGMLQLRASKLTKKSVKLSWKKVAGAKRYIIYGNKCGKTNRMKRQAEVTGTSRNFTKVIGNNGKSAAVKKGTYYKFIIVAIDKDGTVLSTSKVVHAATLGGKVGNDKSVTTKAKKNKVTLKKGKSFKLAAKAVKANKKLKVKKHRGIVYESDNAKIAAVSSKGVIKGKKKGTCYVYAYAQSGAFARIKVTVK